MVNKTIFFSALAALLLMGAGPVVADDEAPPPVEASDEPVEVEVGAEEAAAAAAKSNEALAVPTEAPAAESAPVADSVPAEKTTVEKITVEKVTTETVVESKPQAEKPAEVKKAPAKKKSVVAKKESKKKSKSAKATAKPKPEAPLVAKAERRPPVKRTGQTRPLSDFELGRYQYCGSDRDCVAANNGCCDCANGGADVAVNRERLAAFEARFDCLYVSCSEKDTVPPCGSGIISCVNHKCVYFSNGALEEKF